MPTACERLYLLRLYVTGTSPRSARAIVNVRKICEEHLHDQLRARSGRHCPPPGACARSEQLIAAPTLVKRRPLPVRRFIGDMSQTERIVAGLELGALPGAIPATK